MGELLSLLRLKWDLPWRLAGSVAALVTAAALILGNDPLHVAADVLRWLGATGMIGSLEIAAEWVDERHVLLGAIGFGTFLIAGIFLMAETDRDGGRAPATLLIGCALAIQAGTTAPAWIVAIVAGLWLLAAVARIFMALTASYLPEILAGSEEALRGVLMKPLVAAFYFPVAPITWAVRA